MAFVEVRFPDDISWGAIGGGAFRTTVIESGGGYEQRNIDWQYRRGRWNVGHGAKTEEQMRRLVRFFNAMRGKAHSFRFRDWTYYDALGEQFGVGDNTTVDFQLIRTDTVDTVSYEHKVTKPVAGTVVVYIDGVQQVEGTDYSIDYTTGMVTFVSAPVLLEVLTWDGEFDIPARFDADEMLVSMDFEDVESWEISIVEVRV